MWLGMMFLAISDSYRVIGEVGRGDFYYVKGMIYSGLLAASLNNFNEIFVLDVIREIQVSTHSVRTYPCIPEINIAEVALNLATFQVGV